MNSIAIKVFSDVQNGVQIFENESNSIRAIRRVFPSGMEMMFAIKLPPANTKSNLKTSIEELKSLGLPQKTIALFTGVSQSYVSKLLK